jgi:hypothetical protein
VRESTLDDLAPNGRVDHGITIKRKVVSIKTRGSGELRCRPVTCKPILLLLSSFPSDGRLYTMSDYYATELNKKRNGEVTGQNPLHGFLPRQVNADQVQKAMVCTTLFALHSDCSHMLPSFAF